VVPHNLPLNSSFLWKSWIFQILLKWWILLLNTCLGDENISPGSLLFISDKSVWSLSVSLGFFWHFLGSQSKKVKNTRKIPQISDIFSKTYTEVYHFVGYHNDKYTECNPTHGVFKTTTESFVTTLQQKLWTNLCTSVFL